MQASGFRNLLDMRNWVRPGVCIAPTTIVTDADGFGAFAPSDARTPRASFVGVYTAEKWRRASDDHPYRGGNDYVMQVGLWCAVHRGHGSQTWPSTR